MHRRSTPYSLVEEVHSGWMPAAVSCSSWKKRTSVLDDPNTQSYNQFLHLGAKIDESNIERYKEIFRKRKDRFRRWRDMSMFVMIGVYALSVIDAYVDASLSEFDISDDLSLRFEPTMLNNESRARNPFRSSALGLQCSLTF